MKSKKYYSIYKIIKDDDGIKDLKNIYGSYYLENINSKINYLLNDKKSLSRLKHIILNDMEAITNSKMLYSKVNNSYYVIIKD